MKDCLNLTIGKSSLNILQKSAIKYYYCFGIRMLRPGSEHEFTSKNMSSIWFARVRNFPWQQLNLQNSRKSATFSLRNK